MYTNAQLDIEGMAGMHNEIDNRHEVIQVVFCSNPQYCEHMAVAIASLLAHNPSRRFKLHVVLSGTGEHEKDCIQQLVEKSGNAVIEFRSFDCNTISDFRIDDHITLDSYVRLFLPEILGPEVGKLLYLDCDLLVCADIAELWNTDLGNQILGAVPDAFSEDHVSLGFEEHETYFNAGVLLIDLRRWRSSNLTERAVEYIRTNKTVLRHHDQDAINGVLRRNILPLPLKWNFTPRHADADPSVLNLTRSEFMAIRRNPGIVHFASGFKPWLPGAEPHYKKRYYRYRALTLWEDHNRQRESPAEQLSSLARRLKASVKWHFPSLSGLVRRFTGLGDPIFQRKFAQKRSYIG
jgi:lipopolysaccharide biosynthesis glycosyltransferase